MTVPEVRVSLRALRKDPEAVLDGLSATGDLVWVRAGRQRFLLVNSPDAVHEVIIERSAELVKPRSQAIETGRPAAELVDATIPVARFRRALARGMGAERIAEAPAAVAAAVAAETADWRDGLCVPLMPRLRRIAIRTSCRAAFGSRLGDEEIDRFEDVLRWFDEIPRVTSPASRRLRALSRHGARREYALAQLRDIGGTLVENADLSRPTELTAAVVDLPEIAPGVTPEHRDRLVGELLLGAVGPLTQTAGWLLLRFATEPEAAARVRDEWAGTSLQHTEAFVREVTRLHPTNVRITRSALVDTDVGGEHVPARTRVILNVNRLNRDPRFYDQAERFLPERWLHGRPNSHKLAYVSFGAGERRCLGESIALATLTALLPALAGPWDLSFGELRSSSTGRRQLADDTNVTLRARG